MELNEFKKLDCCLPLHDPKFRKPTPQEIKLVRGYLALTQNQLGLYLGKNVSANGCSAVRKWESNTTSSNYRAIELNAWRRMLYLIGISSPSEDLESAIEHS